MPKFTFSAYTGAQVELTLPAFTFAATATNPPSLQADLELPEFVFAATATSGTLATVSLELPVFEFAAHTGAQAGLELPEFVFAASVTNPPVLRGALELPSFVFAAAGTIGTVGSVALELPEFTFASNVLTGSKLTAALELPRFTFAAATTGVVTETTYAVNLTTGAVTQLLLGAFDKLVTAHGRLYGLRDGALVRLDGDVDGTSTTIPATIRFAPQQFGTLQAKRVDGQVYLNTRENDGVTLTLIADETTSWDYQTQTDAGPALNTHRVKIGRGVTFHSLGLTLRNRAGGRLDVGGIEIPVIPLSRRPL